MDEIVKKYRSELLEQPEPKSEDAETGGQNQAISEKDKSKNKGSGNLKTRQSVHRPAPKE